MNTKLVSKRDFLMMVGGVLVAPQTYSVKGNTPALNAPTGRSATYVIAASDAPDHVKPQTDYVMPSVNADSGAVYNAAIALGYKSIVLTEGTFTFSTTANLSVNGASLTGQGASTILKPVANIDVITVSKLDNRVSNLRIFGDRANRASGNGIIIVVYAGRTTLDNLTIDNVKDSAIYKSHNALETVLNNINATYNGRGLYMLGSGGMTGSNLWMSQNDNEGMWFDGAQWVNISTFRCDANMGNGITITPAIAGYDTNYVFLHNGDIDANHGHGIELRIPNGTVQSILDVQLGSIQFADNGYGTNNTYDDIFYNRLGGSGGLYRFGILNSVFSSPSGYINRYRINLGATGMNAIQIQGNLLMVPGATGTVNVSSAIPNLSAVHNIGWVGY